MGIFDRLDTDPGANPRQGQPATEVEQTAVGPKGAAAQDPEHAEPDPDPESAAPAPADTSQPPAQGPTPLP